MNSLHRILLTTLTIPATSTFLYLLWKSFSFIGRPLGRSLANLIRYLSDDSNNDNTNSGENTTETKLADHQKSQQSLDRTSSTLSAMLGFFLFITLFPLALEGSDEIPSQWLVGGGGGSESERLVSAGLWVGWMAVRCWGETAVVLGVLAGVVKALRLDGGGGAAGVVGPEEKRSS
jgi:hypothetical protein